MGPTDIYYIIHPSPPLKHVPLQTKCPRSNVQQRTVKRGPSSARARWKLTRFHLPGGLFGQESLNVTVNVYVFFARVPVEVRVDAGRVNAPFAR